MSMLKVAAQDPRGQASALAISGGALRVTQAKEPEFLGSILEPVPQGFSGVAAVLGVKNKNTKHFTSAPYVSLMTGDRAVVLLKDELKVLITDAEFNTIAEHQVAPTKNSINVGRSVLVDGFIYASMDRTLFKINAITGKEVGSLQVSIQGAAQVHRDGDELVVIGMGVSVVDIDSFTETRHILQEDMRTNYASPTFYMGHNVAHDGYLYSDSRDGILYKIDLSDFTVAETLDNNLTSRGLVAHNGKLVRLKASGFDLVSLDFNDSESVVGVLPVDTYLQGLSESGYAPYVIRDSNVAGIAFFDGAILRDMWSLAVPAFDAVERHCYITDGGNVVFSSIDATITLEPDLSIRGYYVAQS